MTKQEQINQVLTRGVENIYPNRASLEKVLKSDKKIRLYCGFDPTAPSLHIGNAIQIRKLAQFQKLGHDVIFLIGDFTGMIGDPDKINVRQKLTRQQVLKNSENYKKQASKILDFSGKNPAKVMYNSEWNDKLRFIDLVELASHFTAQQIMVRDMFQERIKKDKPIYLHEFLYPLTQAYDSVAMDVDLEVGGNDQIFNMFCGRDLMKSLKNKEKFVLADKMLTDPSGKKMGKTEGNMVNLDEKPEQMFGQIMSWPDTIITLGLELCTDVSMEEISQINQEIKQGKMNPRDAKVRLAKEIITVHHNKKAAQEAEKEFNKIFQKKERPSEMPVYKIKAQQIDVLDLLFKIKLASSKSKAKQLIEQGGVKIDNVKIKDWKEKITIKDKMIIQVGKRKFVKIKLNH